MKSSGSCQMNKDDRIYVAGHRGLAGSAIVRELKRKGYPSILTCGHDQLDLRDQQATRSYFEKVKPDCVFLAAGKVGGIVANNTYKAEFIFDNLMIAANVIDAAYRCGVRRLLNLGSSCIYPRDAPQPMKEDLLLTGPLESTNEPYAVAKIAALKLCRYYNEQYGTSFLSVMPTNLYGPNDNFDPVSSHVLPALIRKMHDAKLQSGRVTLWGDGTPRREFLYVDDFARAAVFLMERCQADQVGEFMNVGIGTDMTIRELAEEVAEVVGYKDRIEWDHTKPNGTPRKLLDISRIRALGWEPATKLREGLERTYQWYSENLISEQDRVTDG
jgi:GDP-L-fucose synthase